MSAAPLLPLDAERSVLGAVLCAACWDVAAGHRVLRRVQAVGLDPEHFCLGSHGALFGVLVSMADAGLPLDPVSVAAALDERHEDPHVLQRLRVLAAEVVVTSAAEHHATIVIEAALRREIEASVT